MSASSIADRATPSDAPTTSSSSATTSTAAKDALASLAAYIPSEGIALYIAIAALGIAAGVSYWNWVAFALGLLANGFVFAFRYIQNTDAEHKKKHEKRRTKKDWGRLAYLLAVTGALTTVYISAIPGNPWQTMTSISPLVSGTLVVIVAFFIPFIAPIIKLESVTTDGSGGGDGGGGVTADTARSPETNQPLGASGTTTIIPSTDVSEPVSITPSGDDTPLTTPVPASTPRRR
jgi:hypothetical protein